MSSIGPARVPRALARLVASALLALVASTTGTVLRAQAPEQRAYWVASASLDTADAVRRTLNNVVQSGIDTIVAAAPLHGRPAFDGFGELLRQAREHRMRVFAALDLNRVALATDLPSSRDHVLYQHPEWLMVPRDLAPEMWSLDLRSPEYIGRLARWTRAHGDRVDGLYLSPIPTDAAAAVAAAARAFVERYYVDGVELDYAQYPDQHFDYGRRITELFRAEMRASLGTTERARMDGIEAIDPFAYADEFPDEWRRFRQARLTGLVTRVRSAIRSARPGLIVTASISGTADVALATHLQDWRTWLDNRFIDAIATRTGTAARILSDATSSIRIEPAAAPAADRR